MGLTTARRVLPRALPPEALMRITVRLAVAVALVLAASGAHAQFRSPQVAIVSSNLQAVFTSAGQTVNVTTDQRAAQSFQGINVGLPGSLTFAVRNVRGPQWGLAAYDFVATTPVLHELLPGGAPPGWYSLVTYRSGPERLIISLFDASSIIQGSTTYLGVDPLLQGFAVAADPAGTQYSDDSRNPGQQPRILLFRGTGPFAGDAWLCVELDGDQDFDDAVYRLEFFAPTSTRRDSWGRLKQLYR